MSFIKELKRRNVIRVGIAYAVAAWLLIEITATTFPILKLPDWSVPLVTVLVLIGFPLALIFAWAFELTPEGLKKEKDVDRSESITQITGRKLDFVIIGVLAVALVFFASTHQWSGETGKAETADKSIAVLPFVNMSSDPEQEFFSDGLTETLLNALAQLPDLKVSARTSSFFFKGQDIDIREVAEKLGVSNVLEGSVQRDGNRVRIVAQLIEAESGFHLWSNTYDRDLSDIFAVQDDIANSVARAMAATLASDMNDGGAKIESVGTDNIVAYEKYLKGLQQENDFSNASALQAEISFKGALALDPDYYEARLHLAYIYWVQRQVGEITRAESRTYAEPLLNRLLRERPDDGLALALEARIYGYRSIDVEQRVAELIAAINRTPNEPFLYQTLNSLLRRANRPEEGLEWLERGIAVDPLAYALHLMRAHYFDRILGDLDEAEASYARSIELNPNNPSLYSNAATVPWQRKQYAKWFAVIRKGMDIDQLFYDIPVDIALRLYTFGLMDEGDKYLQRAVAIAPDKVRVRMAQLYRPWLLGDHTRARDISEAMLRDEVDDRRAAYSVAAWVFVSSMIELGKTDEGLAVLEELRPGVSSPDFHPGDYGERALQHNAVLALAQSQSKEDTLSMLDAVVPRWDESFPLWRTLPRLVATIELARGQFELARELTIKDLESGLWLPGAARSPYLIYRQSAYYKALALEPSVAERLMELDAEAKNGAEEIWAYIVEQELQL